MKLTNRLNLPQPLVNAVSNDPYDPGICDITVTKLIQPPRKVTIERLHSNEITEDVSERLFALLGSAVHTILERAETEAIVEQRLAIERQGWTISGRFDRLVLTEGILQDYKVCSAYSVRNGSKKEFEYQLNLLATILRENGIPVKKLEVIALLRDWSKSFAEKSPDYPSQQVLRIPIPLWSEEKCEEFLDERIRMHQLARDGNLPDCTPDDQWKKPDQFALLKEGRKTPVRVFDHEVEAQTALRLAGAGHSIDHRIGKAIRCESYCPAAPFCDQYLKETPHEKEAPTAKNPTRKNPADSSEPGSGEQKPGTESR